MCRVLIDCDSTPRGKKPWKRKRGEGAPHIHSPTKPHLHNDLGGLQLVITMHRPHLQIEIASTFTSCTSPLDSRDRDHKTFEDPHCFDAPVKKHPQVTEHLRLPLTQAAGHGITTSKSPEDYRSCDRWQIHLASSVTASAEDLEDLRLSTSTAHYANSRRRPALCDRDVARYVQERGPGNVWSVPVKRSHFPFAGSSSVPRSLLLALFHTKSRGINDHLPSAVTAPPQLVSHGMHFVDLHRRSTLAASHIPLSVGVRLQQITIINPSIRLRSPLVA